MLLSNLLAIYIFLGNRFTDEPEEISSNHNRVFPISSIIMRTIIIISIFVTNPPLLLKFTFANISSGEKEGEKKLGKSNSLLVQRYRFQVSVSASYVPGGGGESEARERFNITPTSQAREWERAGACNGGEEEARKRVFRATEREAFVAVLGGGGARIWQLGSPLFALLEHGPFLEQVLSVASLLVALYSR